jgi:hypothetical protein
VPRRDCAGETRSGRSGGFDALIGVVYSYQDVLDWIVSPCSLIRCVPTPTRCRALRPPSASRSTRRYAPDLTITFFRSTTLTVSCLGVRWYVIQEFTKLLDEDFTWKDPKAAERAGMSLMEYVIGGMDLDFKLKLYHALRALDDAGLSPGITSAFCDDYRQSLASGLKAATDRSYHGGSLPRRLWSRACS